MKERPILFSGPMVRAVLRDVDPKTQTRRLVNLRGTKPDAGRFEQSTVLPALWLGCDADGTTIVLRCPYGAPGDRLWVRETHAAMCRSRDTRVAYREGMIVQNQTPRRPRRDWTVEDLCPWPVDNTMGRGYAVERWTPSIHMPRALSRIDLEVTRVRVQRLHDITEPDALAEGVSQGRIPVDDYGPERIGYVLGADDGACVLYPSAREAFAIGWNAINGDRVLWSSNPWVWAIDFKRVRP